MISKTTDLDKLYLVKIAYSSFRFKLNFSAAQVASKKWGLLHKVIKSGSEIIISIR